MFVIIGADHKLLLWNVGTCEALVEVDLPDLCLSMSFNFNGTQFVTTCKDKKMRIFETRTGNMLGVSTHILQKPPFEILLSFSCT